MQTNKYQEIEKHYQKCIFWEFLRLLPTKKRENLCKAHYIRKQKDFVRKVYNELLYSSKEPKGVYGEGS